MVAEYYPRRRDPVLGVWAHRQALAARAAGADVTVLALERPLPPASALRSPARLGARARRGGRAAAPRRARWAGGGVRALPLSAARAQLRELGQLGARTAREGAGPAHEQQPLDLVHAHYALPAGAAALEFTERERLPLAISVHGGDVLGPLVSTPQPLGRASPRCSAGRASCSATAADARALRRADGLGRADDRGAPGRRGARRTSPPSESSPPSPRSRHVIPRKRHADVMRALAVLGGPAARAALAGDRRRPRAPRARAPGRAARRGRAGGLGRTAPSRRRARANWPAAI